MYPRPVLPEAIELIKHHEGLRLRPYLCPANRPTIGYGHLILRDGRPLPKGLEGLNQAQAIYPNGLTLNEAEQLFASDLNVKAKEVSKLLRGHNFNAYHFSALVSFAFNFGIRKLANSTLIRKFKRGDISGAAKEFPKWRNARVNGALKKLPGLVARRADEQKIFLTEPLHDFV